MKGIFLYQFNYIFNEDEYKTIGSKQSIKDSSNYNHKLFLD